MKVSLTFKLVALLVISIFNYGIWIPKLVSTADTTLVLFGLFLAAINLWVLTIKLAPIIHFILTSNKNK